jgi:hypothetical protein
MVMMGEKGRWVICWVRYGLAWDADLEAKLDLEGCFS